eukprot:TRINITY_DN9947_c0_g2_i3.p1 TRINITY_DN9947_c0_g2~~TRINITY_DN9947_c0_g2_i3.p1  ORF type:complete len:725 (+),score=170.22 TRINITY_DN9947_c0_g2_i3:61-2235(+)
MAALSSAGMATIGAAGAPDQLSIATVLGAAGLAAIAGSSAQVATGDGGQPLVVVQMMKVIAALQAKLHESEEGIHELQAQADQLEEKRRSWSNRLERSERERSKALQQRDQLEAAADEARKEARPLMERHMELEVVKCQVPLLLEDQDRLREEKECHFQELERGWPRLTDAEDAEAQCIEAIAELELAHAEELAHVRSAFTEEGADLRARHATRMAEIEGARQADLAQIRAAHAEELLLLRSAFEDSEWQAEVYVREQQEAVREACIRQRENARIAKRCSEARAEALELAVKLEALRAAGRGAPAREAELEAVRQRCSLLQRTAAEWRESLEKKNRDCERWRRRAAQKGVVSEVDEEEVDIRLASPASASFMSTSAAPTPQPGAGTAPLVAIAAASSSAGGAADVARQSHRAPPALQDVSHGGDASVLSLPAEPLTPVQAASPSADSFMSHDRSVTGLHLPPPNESSWSNVPSPTRTPSLPSRRPLAGAGAGAGRSRGVAPPGARQNRLAVPGAGPQVQLTRRSHPQLPTQQLQEASGEPHLVCRWKLMCGVRHGAKQSEGTSLCRLPEPQSCRRQRQRHRCHCSGPRWARMAMQASIPPVGPLAVFPGSPTRRHRLPSAWLLTQTLRMNLLPLRFARRSCKQRWRLRLQEYHRQRQRQLNRRRRPVLLRLLATARKTECLRAVATFLQPMTQRRQAHPPTLVLERRSGRSSLPLRPTTSACHG